MTFMLYSILSSEQMVQGLDITVPRDADYATTEAAVRAKLAIPAGWDIHLFIAPGIRFSPTRAGEPNRLSGLVESVDRLQRRVYAVIAKKIAEPLLEGIIQGACNCTYAVKLLLTAACDITPRGLTGLATLLGYFRYGGVQSQKFLQLLAHFTDFASLICGLYAITDRSRLFTSSSACTRDS
jgi:hypothetical protein